MPALQPLSLCDIVPLTSAIIPAPTLGRQFLKTVLVVKSDWTRRRSASSRCQRSCCASHSRDHSSSSPGRASGRTVPRRCLLSSSYLVGEGGFEPPTPCL
jgi:hypothetical protein